jgi:hypothetical protein
MVWNKPITTAINNQIMFGSDITNSNKPVQDLKMVSFLLGNSYVDLMHPSGEAVFDSWGQIPSIGELTLKNLYDDFVHLYSFKPSISPPSGNGTEDTDEKIVFDNLISLTRQVLSHSTMSEDVARGYVEKITRESEGRPFDTRKSSEIELAKLVARIIHDIFEEVIANRS